MCIVNSPLPIQVLICQVGGGEEGWGASPNNLYVHTSCKKKRKVEWEFGSTALTPYVA